ncbi:MAG: hypothetical protein ACI87J_002721 [Colwellia sp.]|jgi:hypothetical protein
MSRPDHSASNKYKDRNSKNTHNLKIWTITWVISMAITTFTPKYLWDFNTTIICHHSCSNRIWYVSGQ